METQAAVVGGTGAVDEGVRQIVASFRGRKGFLIPLLQAIQHHCGYLPADVLEYISQELLVPLAEIYGVCTFYAQFHLKPRGRHIVRVCRGTACHVRGSLAIMEKLKSVLKVEENGTTEDLRFTLEPVACLGACGLAPVLMVNDETHGRLTPEDAARILDNYA
jgi:NADH-quinone oxidoreductase subunit E